ncbi:MAG: hypothetical protein IJ373_06305, partial [Clostridia bacterium]|nr:hypothetical protein [Clostridia bacterium]
MAIEKLTPLNHYAIENPPTVYDEEALTALELAARSAYKVNEIIALLLEECKEQNLTIDEAVRYMKDHLSETAHDLLYSMADRGDIDVLLRRNYQAIRENILPIANVKEFGAVGDGVADDSEALEAAMMEHTHIYFPAGTYRIRTSFEINSSVHIFGAGAGLTKIIYEGSNYLFRVTTRFGNQPLFEGITFEGNTTNGFINCDAQAWGATFALRDFKILQFKDVFRLASAFGCIIENGVIMTYGKITFTTFDGTAKETNFNNCNIFRNVYFSAYSTTRNLCHFDMFNVRDLTFEKCQLERVETFMSMRNMCRMIRFRDCWIENVGVFYSMDDTCVAPATENCNFVEVTKRNNGASALDYIKGAPSIKDISGGKNVWKTMLSEDIELDGEAIQSPTDGYSDWMWAYIINTKFADFRMPINTRAVRRENVTEVTQDLNAILYYSPISATFKINVFCQYSDFGSRLFRVTVYRRSSSWFIHKEEISDTTW